MIIDPSKAVANRAYDDFKVGMESVGLVAYIDDGFTCHEPGPVVIKKDDDGDWYFLCEEGHHLLDGQKSDCGTYYVGMTLVKP